MSENSKNKLELVQEYAKRYLLKAKAENISHATFLCNKSILKRFVNFIASTYGDIKPPKICEGDIQAWVEDLRSLRLSKSTIYNYTKTVCNMYYQIGGLYVSVEDAGIGDIKPSSLVTISNIGARVPKYELVAKLIEGDMPTTKGRAITRARLCRKYRIAPTTMSRAIEVVPGIASVRKGHAFAYYRDLTGGSGKSREDKGKEGRASYPLQWKRPDKQTELPVLSQPEPEPQVEQQPLVPAIDTTIQPTWINRKTPKLKSGYFARLWAAILNRDCGDEAVSTIQ